jgi:hypothetical protein
MFVRYYLEVPLAFEAAESLLLRAPRAWLPGLASDANSRAELLLTEVGFGDPGRRVEKRVQVEIREPVRFPSKTVLPLHWAATGPHALFPELDADIEIAPLGSDWSQLAISARYRPPLGFVGTAIDRALLHRVAEATIKDFLDRAAVALQELATSPPTAAAGV